LSTYNIQITEPAEEDLHEIGDYIFKLDKVEEIGITIETKQTWRKPSSGTTEFQ
jgi:hypothetical protein